MTPTRRLWLIATGAAAALMLSEMLGPPPAQAGVEAITVRLEEARCFS